MDGDRFDALARSLATPRSRRAVVRVVAGSAAGGLLALVGAGRAGADPCKGTGKECKKGIQCCSGSCAPPTDSISTHGSGRRSLPGRRPLLSGSNLPERDLQLLTHGRIQARAGGPGASLARRDIKETIAPSSFSSTRLAAARERIGR